jgi:uncharacterized protein DUF222
MIQRAMSTQPAWMQTSLEANHLADCRSVHARLTQIATTRGALDANEAELLLAADELQIWRAYGQPTLAAYLEQTLGYGPHACSERLRVARELHELPQLHAALAAGRLHFSAVRELTRVATRDTEEAWIAEADGRTVRQVEQAVAGHTKGDLPSDPADPDTALSHVGFELTPATIAAFRAMRKQLDAEVGERLTDDQLFQILARRALEPAAAADSPPASQVAFMVCPSCKAATADGAGMIADVTPAQLDAAMCDAELLGDVEREPEPVRKTITPRLRRQVFARDHHRCTVPGCRSGRNLDIHHVHFQSHGGSHAIWNVTLQCSAHHALIHEGKLRVSGKAPDLVYERRTEDGDGWQRIY